MIYRSNPVVSPLQCIPGSDTFRGKVTQVRPSLTPLNASPRISRTDFDCDEGGDKGTGLGRCTGTELSLPSLHTTVTHDFPKRHIIHLLQKSYD